jgi:hypothetical protein
VKSHDSKRAARRDAVGGISERRWRRPHVPWRRRGTRRRCERRAWLRIPRRPPTRGRVGGLVACFRPPPGRAPACARERWWLGSGDGARRRWRRSGAIKGGRALCILRRRVGSTPLPAAEYFISPLSFQHAVSILPAASRFTDGLRSSDFTM